jgi:hypothetical protein
LASTTFCTSGVIWRSLTNGLPGAARIMKKARVTTRNIVGMATSRRRDRNRSMTAFDR